MIHQKALTFTPPVCSVRQREKTMARTNIDIDSRLVREGLRTFRCKSKRELMHLALTELLREAKRKEILKLRGQVKWEAELEELRRSRL